MVKIILAFAGIAFVMGIVLTTFNGTLPKLESMQGNLAGGASRFDKDDYQADMEKAKVEAREQYLLNAQRLAGVRAEIGVKKYDHEYMKKINTLDKRNTDLKLKMDHYRAEGSDNWKVFKGNFNRDMEKVTKECKALAVAVKKI